MTTRILFKLSLLTIVPLVVTAGMVLLLVTSITIRDLESGLEQSLSDKARLVETSLRDQQPSQYQASAVDLASRAQARLTVIDARGEVLADSEADPSRMENHASRPEFLEALNGTTSVSRRFSSTLGTEFLYIAVPMQSGGAVRMALPLDEVTSLASANRTRITSVIVLIVVPLIAVTLWSGRRISTQLSRLVSLSNEIANGNFEVEHLAPRRGDLRELNELTKGLQGTARKLRLSFNQLREERSRFAAAVNSIGEGILVCDRKLRIVLYNPAVARMFPDEALENSSSVAGWTRKEIPAIFKQAVKAGAACSAGLSLGEPPRRCWRVSCAPILSRKGKIRAIAAVFHDISELEHVDKMRRDFVINVSHELRTPLASITGYAETLLDGAINDKRNNLRFVRILLRNARRLEQLTSDLMTLSQIEVEAREFEFQRQAAHEQLQLAAEAIRPLLERKRLQLEVDPVRSNLMVDCDVSAIQQILANLLDNAAKYTPEHGKIVLGAIERDSELDIYVRDTGVGIADEHIPRVFERFYRVDKARSRELGGTGLGLAIVKHLVQAHKGAAWVESELGVGTTFWFSLPFVHQPPPQALVPDSKPELTVN